VLDGGLDDDGRGWGSGTVQERCWTALAVPVLELRPLAREGTRCKGGSRDHLRRASPCSASRPFSYSALPLISSALLLLLCSTRPLTRSDSSAQNTARCTATTARTTCDLSARLDDRQRRRALVPLTFRSPSPRRATSRRRPTRRRAPRAPRPARSRPRRAAAASPARRGARSASPPRRAGLLPPLLPLLRRPHPLLDQRAASPPQPRPRTPCSPRSACAPAAQTTAQRRRAVRRPLARARGRGARSARGGPSRRRGGRAG